MTKELEVVVVGASQSGLSVSYRLKERGLEHLVLEQHQQVGFAWEHERWDSFTLVTPNWFLQLPGLEYQGDDPDGFLPRDEIVAYLNDYRNLVDPPLRLGTEVRELEKSDDVFLVHTSEGVLRTRNVVVATGYFHRERIPDFAANLAPDILQLTPSTYKNPEQAPDGATLVVGSSMSGIQICEDFIEAGRPVYLSVGSGYRVPRRYRGRDAFAWMVDFGWLHKPVDPETHAERYQASLQLSGARGGRNISLHDFARKGAILLGQLKGTDGRELFFAQDLNDRLDAADAFDREFKAEVDAFVTAKGLDCPAREEGEMQSALQANYPQPTELDLQAANIRTVIWTTGYTCDYGWIDQPVFDDRGFPHQQRGITEEPGLYFCGQHWLYNFASGGFFGVGDDAAHIADHIVARRQLAAE